jgi:outer membrane lipoprotein-sorting protein
LAVLVGLAQPAKAFDREAASLLLASENAEKRVSYAGTKVIRIYRPEDGTLVTERVVRVWHREPSQTRIEIVSPAENLGMVMVDNGESLWIFHPRRQAWRQMRWKAPEACPRLLLRNYDAQILRREPVAGRSAITLRLTSRHPGNPSKTVWIDTDSKLALRHEIFDPSGRRVSTSEFRDIALEASLPANLFTIPAEARVEQRRRGRPLEPWLVPEKGSPALTIEPPRYVPAGYELMSRFGFRRGEREFAHLRYTDGLNTLSLFVERKPRDGDAGAEDGARAAGQEVKREKRGGGTGSRDLRSGDHGHSLTWTRGDARYTLVGNISVKELKRMAASIPAPKVEARR